MRLGEADNADHQWRIGEPALLDFDIRRLGVRIFPRKHLCDHIAGADTGIALEHDGAPGRELAMIGHPRADRQDGFEFGRRGAGASHLARLHRAAGLEEFQGVGHRDSVFTSCSRYLYLARDSKPKQLIKRLVPRRDYASFAGVRVIALGTIEAFLDLGTGAADAREPLMAWYRQVVQDA